MPLPPSLNLGTVERYGPAVEFRGPGSLPISGPSELLVSRSLRCAFDPGGALVERTVGFWDRADIPRAVQATLPSPNVVSVCNEEVVWGGGIVNAYGHFLIESVSRLWPLLPDGELEGLPVVWATPRELPYVSDWRKAFGAQAFELPGDGIVHFTKMFVPEPAWRLNAWIAPEIRDVHRHARAGLDVPFFPRSRVLWLSRSGLPRARIAYDELLLEWLLRKHVTIISPETMSLGAQIAAIEASEAIAGIVGSAFHAMLMANTVPRCVLLCGSQVRAAYVDQGSLLDQDFHFAHALALVEATPSGRARFPVKFPFGYRVLIPEVLRELARTVLPELLEDGLLRELVSPECLSVNGRGEESELTTAIARVLIDPMWMSARMSLARVFEEEGFYECALEQYTMVSELSEAYGARASHYAARNLARLGQSLKASEMALRALSLDSESKETAAAAYVLERQQT
jgi:hypothetical protein